MPVTRFQLGKKRKLKVSDPETDSSLDDDNSSDEYLMGESNDEKSCESDNEQADNAIKDNAQEDSESKSDLPLSERMPSFWRDLKWIEQSEQSSFIPIVHPFTDMNAGVQSQSGLDSNSSLIEIFKKFFSEELMEKVDLF